MKVYSKRSSWPQDAVYIGRPTKWGNPFVLKVDTQTERELVLDAYRDWLLTQPQLIEAAKQELKGKDLLCWCAPKLCHGDVLLKIANGGSI